MSRRRFSDPAGGFRAPGCVAPGRLPGPAFFFLSFFQDLLAGQKMPEKTLSDFCNCVLKLLAIQKISKSTHWQERTCTPVGAPRISGAPFLRLLGNSRGFRLRLAGKLQINGIAKPDFAAVFLDGFFYLGEKFRADPFLHRDVIGVSACRGTGLFCLGDRKDGDIRLTRISPVCLAFFGGRFASLLALQGTLSPAPLPPFVKGGRKLYPLLAFGLCFTGADI